MFIRLSFLVIVASTLGSCGDFSGMPYTYPYAPAGVPFGTQGQTGAEAAGGTGSGGY